MAEVASKATYVKLQQLRGRNRVWGVSHIFRLLVLNILPFVLFSVVIFVELVFSQDTSKFPSPENICRRWAKSSSPSTPPSPSPSPLFTSISSRHKSTLWQQSWFHLNCWLQPLQRGTAKVEKDAKKGAKTLNFLCQRLTRKDISAKLLYFA